MLEEMNKEELIVLVKQLQKRKEYGLVWNKDEEDVVEQCKQELPVLEEVKEKAVFVNENVPTNILIEGDNYHSLATLNYTHKGKVDFIYIDPPYNTGASDWRYNNAYVNSDDPYKHSKWLNMMNRRLLLAKNLLADTGIICVTIDDYEMPRLWLLLETIFNENNHLGTVVIRNNPKGRKTERKVSLIHEYAIFFGRTQKAKMKKLPIDPVDKTHNYKKDNDGNWYLPVNLRKQGVDSSAYNKKGELKDRWYPIYFDPKSKKLSTKDKLPVEIWPTDSNGEKRIWRRGEEVIDKMYKSGDLWVNKTKYGNQVYFRFTGGLEGEPAQSMWYDSKFSASEYGTQILDNILGKREQFQYPKSPYAVKQCIQAATSNTSAVILDFFAGSGTTGHATLMLNKEDGGKRRFILCTNNENGIAEDVCYPRIKKVLDGHSKLPDITGIKSNLRYFKTDFVPSAPTDKNKIKLTNEATHLLCVKENTFEEVKSAENYKIFKNKNRYTGIIFDPDAIDKFKKEVNLLEGEHNVYIFSLSDDFYEEEFSDLEKSVTILPIPEAILRVYRRIFK
jgi:adenine-specific DNA-methyltransferase